MNKKVKVCLALFLALAVIAQYSFSPSAMFAYGLNNTDNTVQTEEAGNDGQPADDQKTAEPTEATEATEAGDDAKAKEPAEADKGSADDSQKEPDEQDVDYPAKDFSETVDGVKVNISAPEGALPEGTTVEVEKVAAKEIMDSVQDLYKDASIIKAVDITFRSKDGKEIEPDKKVSVTFASSEFKKLKEAEIVHINDDGDAEKVKGSSVDGNKASFKADEFSVYVVIDTVNPRLTVTFKNGDTTIDTMYIKKSDTAGEIKQIIYDPGAGTVPEGQVFKGWVKVSNYTSSTEVLTIDDVRSDAKTTVSGLTSDGEVTYYAAFYKRYTMTYEDTNGVNVGSEVAEVPGSQTEATYKINQGYSTDDTHNFEGWSVKTGGDNIVGYPGNAHSEEIGGKTVYYYPNGTEIKVTGDVVFTVDAPEGHWLVFDENGKGAKYNAPRFLKTEDVTSKPCEDDEMTRMGYQFDGWYTGKPATQGGDPTGTKFTFGSTIDSNTTLYAKWKPNTTASYTIVFWTQNLGRNGYEVADSYVNKNGAVGSRIPYTVRENGDEDYVAVTGTDYGHYKGFCLTEASKNQNVTITPEGDAVLDLYYDRIEYNFKFYLYRDGTRDNRYDYAENSGNGRSLNDLVTWHSNQNEHPSVSGYNIQSENVGGRTYYYFVMNAYYGEDISSKWPTYDKISGANGREAVSYVMMVGTKLKPNPTSGGSGTVKGTITVLDENILGATNDSNGNYVIVRFPGNFNQWRYHIWFETVDGEDYPGKPKHTYNGKTYYEDTVMEVRSSNTEVGSQNPPTYAGFDFLDKRGQNWNNSNYWTTGSGSNQQYHLNFVYNRQKFKITYFDGNYVDGDNKTIQNHASQPLHESGEIGQGANVEAYKNYVPALPEGEEGYVFEGWYLDEGCTTPYKWSTMPVGGITVYAKWRQIQYRVFLHPNAGTDPSLSWGVDEHGDEVKQEMNFRESFGGKVSPPDGTRTGYEFYGWYTDSALTQVFSPSTELNEETVTENYDKTTHMTDPMDKWGNGATWNSDVQDEEGNPRNRFWITKEFNLYAKWSEVLVGASGINVVYDAGEGSNPPEDKAKYMDSASVAAGAAPTAPQGKVFKHWIVQKWNGTDYEDAKDAEGKTITVLPGGSFKVLKENAKITDNNASGAVVDPEDVKADGNYTYTVQLKAFYEKPEAKTPTHINWYSNYGSENDGKGVLYKEDKDIAINEAVDIYGYNKDSGKFTIPEREGYTFVGWTKTKGGTEADFLEWDADNEKYVAKVGERNYDATQVAADEKSPTEDLFAAWHTNLTIEVKDATKRYTGSEQQGYVAGGSITATGTGSVIDNEQYKITGLAEGDVLTVTDYTPSHGTNPGTYNNGSFGNHKTIKIMRGETDVTKSYKIKTTAGKLTIENKKPLKITAKPQTYTYNGSAQGPAGTYTSGFNTYVTVEGLDEGDELTSITLSGSETNKGVYQNKIEPSAAQIGNNTDKYEITYVKATLTINPREVTITANNASKSYDGKPLTEDGYTVSGLATGDTHTFAVVMTDDSTITDKGTQPNVIATVDGVAVTTGSAIEIGNYLVTTATGTLTITLREITIKALDSSQIYNGSALTEGGFSVTSRPSTDTHMFDVVMTADSTITNVGTQPNVIATVDGVAVTTGKATEVGNYLVTTENGTLTVYRKTVTITAGSATKPYDGTPLTEKGFEVSKLETGDTHTFTVVMTDDSTITDKGTQPNVIAKVDEVPVTTGSATEVGNYLVKTVNGLLTITEDDKALVITSATKSWTYDSDLHKDETYTVTYDGKSVPAGTDGKTFTLPNKDVVTITATAAGVRNVSDNAPNNNTYTYTIKRGDKDVSGNYKTKVANVGTLTINPKAVTITAKSANKPYDGTPLTESGFTVSELETGDAHKFTVVMTDDSTITDKGEQPNVIAKVDGVEVTSGEETAVGNYLVTTADGALIITARPITIQANNASNVYTGGTITYATAGDAVAPYYQITNTAEGEGLVDGQSITAIALTGEGIAVDTYPIRITEGSVAIGDNTANYNITLQPGTLTINPKGVTITANSASKKYDGSPLTESGFEATALESGDAHTFVVTMTEDSTITNAGTQPNVIAEVDGVEVTAGTAVRVGNYSITAVNGTLAVSKLSMTITSASAEKVYDGSPLTRNNPATDITISGDAFVPNEATIVITGKQTPVGTSDNTFVVVFKDGSMSAMSGVVSAFATADNYNIKKVYGKLTVTAPTPTPPAGGGGNPPGGGGGNPPGGGGGNPAVAAPAAPAAPATIVDTPAPTTIIDEPAPKAITAYWALINLICAILTAILSIIMLIRFFTRRKEENEETGEEEKVQRKGALRIASIIPAIGAIIAFILTEDMSLPMQMVDKWTILMIIILAIQVLVAIFANFRREDDDEEEADATA